MAAIRIGLLALTISLTSCATTPTQTPTNPGAQPTFSCTPEAGGTPSPCHEHDYQQSQTRDKLYTQAETVYRKRLAEDERIYRAGGVTEPTPVMLETTTGEALTNMLADYRRAHKAKTKAIGGQFKLAYLKRVPGLTKGTSVVTLETCIDASSVKMVRPGSTDDGAITARRMYFSPDRTVLKVSYVEYKEVETCS